MRRRVLLAGVCALPMLAACGGSVPPSLPNATVDVVATDVKLIANGLKGVLTQLAALPTPVPGLTPQVLGTCQAALSGLESSATAIAGASTTAEAQPTVRQVERYVNAFVGALALLPLPPPINTALMAATILLPVIETAVELVAPIPAASAQAAMTADQARAALATTSAATPSTSPSGH